MVEARERHVEQVPNPGVHRDAPTRICGHAGAGPSCAGARGALARRYGRHDSVHVPGFSLHDELELFVEAGLSPMQALETATTNPALCLGSSKTWGRVRPGYTANLVLLAANPLADISNLTRIDAVVWNGELLDRARLDSMLDDAAAPVRAAAAPTPSATPPAPVSPTRR